MKKLKRTISILMSACLMLSALTCMLTTTASADPGQEANAAPQASYTYDFTDTTKFNAGESVFTQADGLCDIRIRDSETGSDYQGNLRSFNIFNDTENTAGLGAGKQMLLLGKDVTTQYGRSAALINFVHPNNSVVEAGETKVYKQYPVSELSMDVRLPYGDVKRKGFVLSRGKADMSYDSANNCFNVNQSVTFFSMKSDDTAGFKFFMRDTCTLSYRYYLDAENNIDIKIINGTAINNNDSQYASGTESKYSTQRVTNSLGKKPTSLAGYVIDADGNVISEDLQSILNSYFKKKKSLSTEEYWVHLNAVAKDSNTTQYVFTLNLSDYAVLREDNAGLPESLRLLINVGNDYNSGTSQFGICTVGTVASQANYKTNGIAISNISLKYDISSYYAEAAAEFKTSFLSGYGTLTSDLLKAEDLTAVNELLEKYNALDAGVKGVLASDNEVQTKLSTLNAAKAALDDGAYMFDAFEGALNWQTEGKISNFSNKIATDGDLIDCSDNLTPTNVYSAEATSNAGDADGNAFWGIHTDKTNEYNKALWLRKSFNEYNMDPTQAVNRQTWPSVLYTLKDDVLPAGAKVEKITGKMYYSQNNYKRGIGILYNYTNEFKWDTIAATLTSFRQLYRTSENSGRLANEDLKNDSNSAVSLSTLDKDQWVDFVFEYDYEKGRYNLTLTGKDTDTNKLASYTMNTPACELLSKVGICHAFETNQSVDNIAVKLANISEPDYNPQVLGAKILKQATATGDQNLRIDFDFSNVIANGADKNITEYGVILQAGSQNKATLTDSSNSQRTVLGTAITEVSEIPSLYTVTITNSAANAGKRVSAIAYIKDSDGNYYYSANNSEVVTDGLAQKSVMGVMKAWYKDMETNESANLNAAAQRYVEGENPEGIDAAAALDKASRYANGSVTTTDSEYAECKTILSRIFYNFYNTNA